MASIWEVQTRLQDLVRDRGACGDALAELGVIPKAAAKTIWAKARDATFNVERIDEIERETKHRRHRLPDPSGGNRRPRGALSCIRACTSSDVLDTCLNVQLTRAADLLIADVDKVLAALRSAPSSTR